MKGLSWFIMALCVVLVVAPAWAEEATPSDGAELNEETGAVDNTEGTAEEETTGAVGGNEAPQVDEQTEPGGDLSEVPVGDESGGQLEEAPPIAGTCEGVTCSGHGTWVIVLDVPACQCERGFTHSSALPNPMHLLVCTPSVESSRVQNTGQETISMGQQALVETPAEAPRRSPRLVVRGSVGFLPYPEFHAIVPEIAVGLHWSRGRVDLRLMLQGGPFVPVVDGGDVGGQGHLVFGVLSTFRRFFLNVESGLGGGWMYKRRPSSYREEAELSSLVLPTTPGRAGWYGVRGGVVRETLEHHPGCPCPWNRDAAFWITKE